MDCPDDADQVFGPVVVQCRRDFDFTLFFEQSVLAVGPYAVFILLAVARLVVLVRRHRGRSSSSWGWLSVAKLSTSLVSVALAVAVLAQNATATAAFRPPHTAASVPAAALALVAAVLVCCLSSLEHTASLRPSSLLLAYSFGNILCLLPQIRTYWLMTESAVNTATATATTALAATLTADCACKLVLFALETRNKRGLPLYVSGMQDVAAEELAGPISRTFYEWLSVLLIKGFRGSFTPADITPIDTVLRSSSLCTRFAPITTTREDHYAKDGLAFATLRSIGWPLLAPVLPRLAVTFFTFAQSFLVTAMLDYLQSTTDVPANHGYGLIGACIFVYVGIAVSNSWYWSLTYRFVTMARGGLTIAIFEKMLRLQQDSNIGSQAMTLMVSDIQRIVSGLTFVHEIWAGAVETVVATYLLWRIIGVSCLTMLALALASSFASTWVSKALSTQQQTWLSKMQDRIEATRRMLDSLKVIKMLGSETRISQAINALRALEIHAARPFRVLITSTVGLSYSTLTLSPFLVFATYIGISGSTHAQLDTTKMFSSLVLISLLGSPLVHIFQALPMLGSAHGCFRRIQAFLDKDEARRPVAIPWVPADGAAPPEKQPLQVYAGTSSATAVLARDAAFAWSADSSPILKHVDLDVAKGAQIAIIGRVGSGKSLLMNALVGEADKVQGTVDVNTGSIAYCSQVPWLENTSAKLAWSEHGHGDAAWMQLVQECCALGDIVALDDYASGTIGSGGARLSGGQRQRLALARAVSLKRELVLLDDVFSALDHTTRSTISSRLLGPDGLFRTLKTTVIFTTHDMQIARLADKVYEIDADGKLVNVTTLPAVSAKPEAPEVLSGSSEIEPEKPPAVPTPVPAASAPDNAPNSDQSNRSSARIVPTKPAAVRDRDVYVRYFKSIGFANTFLFLGGGVVFAVALKFPDLWTQWWSTAISKGHAENTAYWLGIFGMLELLPLVVLTVWVLHLMLRVVPTSAYALHDALLATTLRAPFAFLSRTDTGSLMNRFNQDLMFVDSQLPLNMVNTCAELFTALFQMVLIAIVSAQAVAVLPPLFVALFLLQNFYLRTSKQLRLLELASKADLHTKFAETAAGLCTLRANGWTGWMRAKFLDTFDRSQEPFYLLFMVQRWLQLVLNLIVAALAIAIAGVAVALRSRVVAGAVGVAFLNATTLGETLTNLILSWTSLETSLGAIARVAAFERDTPAEAEKPPARDGDDGSHAPVPAAWPQRGAVRLAHVWASYAATDVADPVWNLRDVTLDVAPGTRVAVCGRTGSGKSTLLLALLGMVDVPFGTIVVDGVDLAQVHMPALRHRFQVVSQNCAIGSVTFRQELDPAQMFSDDEITAMLQACGVWDAVVAAGGLASLRDDKSLSAGEAQVLSIARILLQHQRGTTSAEAGGIVLLDEVTSSMDPQTEERIEALIADTLKGKTVISVLHRVRAAARYDKIAVLEQGVLVDYGVAADIVQRSDLFKSSPEQM